MKIEILSSSTIAENTDFDRQFSVKVNVPKSSFVKTLTKNWKSLVVMEISKVDTIFDIDTGSNILRTTTNLHDEKIVSNIVSVFSKNAKNLFLPGPPLNLTFRHIILDSGKRVCTHWDIHKNTWSTEGCVTQVTNETHTHCSCQYLSTYAVLQKQSGSSIMDQTTVWIIAITLSTLIFLFIVSVILIIYCRRVKVRAAVTLT